MKPELASELLRQEAHNFAQTESQHSEPSLFGVTDGKVGDIDGIFRVL